METIKANELKTLDTFQTSRKARKAFTVKRIEVVDETWQAPKDHLGMLIVWAYQTGCKQFVFKPDNELFLLHRVGQHKTETQNELPF